MTIAIAANTPSTEKPTLLIENVFTQGTLFSTGGGVPENALGDNTFEFWTTAIATATIEVDTGDAVNCDMVGIAAHNLGSEGATVEVQSSDNGTDWTTRLTVTPTDDSAIVGVFPAVSAQYWRLRITGATVAIGVIKLGKRIIVPSGVSLGHVAMNHSARLELLTNDSVDGQFLNTRVIRRSGETTLDFGLVPASFVDTDMLEFERLYNEGRTFFYAGNPVDLPRDVGYCKRPMGASEMRPFYEGGELMQLDFEAQIHVG